MFNPYQILGLNPTGNGVRVAEIKKAYRDKARALHPDKHPHVSDKEKESFQEAFKVLNEAYSIALENCEGIAINSEEILIENFLEELKELVSKWPLPDQAIANQFLNDSDVVKNIYQLKLNSVVTFHLFRKPLDPLLWELFSNQHYVSNINKPNFAGYPPEQNLEELLDTFRTEITFNRVILFCKDTYETGGPEVPKPETLLTDKEKFWFYVAGIVENLPHMTDHHVRFLYSLKWSLIKKYLSEYIENKGAVHGNTIGNILNIFGCLYKNQAGRYMSIVDESLIIPLKEKIQELSVKNDYASICKVAQIEELIVSIESECTSVIESFLVKHKDTRATRKDIREHITNMHESMVRKIESYEKNEVINQRRNLIQDILKAVFGVFLAAVGLGFPLFSKEFRNKFFYTDTKSRLVNAKDSLDERMPLIRDRERFPHFDVL